MSTNPSAPASFPIHQVGHQSPASPAFPSAAAYLSKIRQARPRAFSPASRAPDVSYESDSSIDQTAAARCTYGIRPRIRRRKVLVKPADRCPTEPQSRTAHELSSDEQLGTDGGVDTTGRARSRRRARLARDEGNRKRWQRFGLLASDEGVWEETVVPEPRAGELERLRRYLMQESCGYQSDSEAIYTGSEAGGDDVEMVEVEYSVRSSGESADDQDSDDGSGKPGRWADDDTDGNRRNWRDAKLGILADAMVAGAGGSGSDLSSGDSDGGEAPLKKKARRT